MPNKLLASEWLESGKKHLEAAGILFRNGHYNDIVGIELQQAIERILKAIPAYNNRSIIRTHDLAILIEDTKGELEFDLETKTQCVIATDYYQDNRYPAKGTTFLPNDQEISKVIETAESIYRR